MSLLLLYWAIFTVDFQSLYDDHASILGKVKDLRALVQDGINDNAEAIASTLASMSEEIRLHLSIEDANIYPALLQHENAKVRELAAKYQMDMGQLLVVYQGFANKFTNAEQITAAPDDFRKDANMVFQALFERIKAENQNLYPAAMEALKA